MRSLYTLFLFILLPACLLAQQLPETYQIKTDTGTNNQIDRKYWQRLDDPTGELTIDQVSQPPFADGFQFTGSKTKTKNYSSIFWYRYRLKNVTGHDIKVALPENCQEARVYTRDSVSHRWMVKINGTAVPWSKRDGLKKDPYIIVTLKPGQEKLIYEREHYYRNSPTSFNYLAIGYYDAVVQKFFIEENNRDNRFNGKHPVLISVLTGILLLAGIINLIFFGIVKERFYLYFGLYALFSAIGGFLRETDVWFREMPGAVFYITTVCAGIALALNLIFTRIYLDVKRISKNTDKALVVLTIIGGIAGALTGFLQDILSQMPFLFVNVAGVICAWIASLLILIIVIKTLISRTPGAYIKALIIGPLNLLPVFSLAVILVNVMALAFKAAGGMWGLTLWLGQNTAALNLFFSSWLIIGMSVVLFRRFQDLQNKIVYDALERERFEREKEVERNQLIARQNEELELQVATRTAELSKSLTDLKATQTQLIQSEKMASLGELTAGIAHEIQNPLNFVNNFSEVSRELLAEMKEELAAGNLVEVKDIAADIDQNLEKIHHHGKRADSIVKGMLEHSRASVGRKELTDLNKLVDEYLRLAYHGLRAKDKSFNAELIINFDETLPKVNIVQQDIGRVLLNLFNNAFYAIQQRQKNTGAAYQPQVIISTLTTNGNLIVKVADNGNGIPEAIKDKIMQPFFTTKPTGEGTGLGLSLSYDIVVKGHGGNIHVESKVDEGTEFVIQIPLI